MAPMSPMMQQYLQVKKENKDRIVFFRVGDFYEMFFEDAVLASKELELTLTGKECGQEERAPMCGVPHHSAEAYIARLIEKGYKVVICEQTEDASQAKGLMRREVVRVVTPGTVIENSMLQDDRNNYIGSIFLQDNEVGICFADISTGTAHISYQQGDKIAKAVISELALFSPREILFNSEILKYKEITDFIKKQMSCSVELLDDKEFTQEITEPRLRQQFGQAVTDAAGLPYDKLGLQALGALIGYLQNTQKHGVERLKTLTAYTENQHMHLAPITRTNLELTETMRGREKRGTLLWVLDKTSTAMGKRLMRSWLEQPLMNVNAIKNRLDGVEELFNDNVARLEIAENLSHVFDMERLMTRIVYGSALPREISALGATCEWLPVLRKQIKVFKSGEMKELCAGIDPLSDIQKLIKKTLHDELPATLKDGGVIRQGYSAEVDELRDIVSGGKDVLAEIEAELKEKTGIRTLRIGYNRVFGYYIEVSKSFVEQVPDYFVRKQTLTSGERYITDELKLLENKILGANERLAVLERDLFDKLLKEISNELVRIQKTATNVARLDVFVSLAQVAVEKNYVRPQVNESDKLVITQARHPVIEQMQQGSLFVPNDVNMDCDENRMMVITGPNMAGKSTYMRQTALIVIMAQVGSFVPASACSIGICDAVFTRVGASDDLAQGQSTFMVEMREVAEILQTSTRKSLVILDEIGRGTSTFDGMSIAQAVVEYMADEETGCKTMFATHYHELTELENALSGVKNYNIAVKKRGDEITFLRRIVRGAADDSYGIQVAKLAGVPEKVIGRSKQVLKALEATSMGANRVSQLNFEAVDDLQAVKAPAEVMDMLKQLDPETLTPLEALKFVYELKNELGKE